MLFKSGTISAPLVAFAYDEVSGQALFGALDLRKFEPTTLNPLALIELEQGFQYLWGQYFLQVGDEWILGIHYLEGMPDEMLLVGTMFLGTVYSAFCYSDKPSERFVVLAQRRP